jgi:hypothetical protein
MDVLRRMLRYLKAHSRAMRGCLVVAAGMRMLTAELESIGEQIAERRELLARLTRECAQMREEASRRAGEPVSCESGNEGE